MPGSAQLYPCKANRWERIDLDPPPGYGSLLFPVRRNGSYTSPVPVGQVYWQKDRPGGIITDGGNNDAEVAGAGGVIAIDGSGKYWIYQTDSSSYTIEYGVRYVPLEILSSFLPSGVNRRQITQYTIAASTVTLVANSRPFRKSFIVIWTSGDGSKFLWVREHNNAFGSGPPYKGFPLGLPAAYSFEGDNNLTGDIYIRNDSTTTSALVTVIDNYLE